MENEEDMKAKRAEAVEELRSAFSEIESGDSSSEPLSIIWP